MGKEVEEILRILFWQFALCQRSVALPKERSNLLSNVISLAEFFKAKQGQNVPKRDQSNLETLLIDLFHCKV